MKITKTKLNNIIKEETEKLVTEIAARAGIIGIDDSAIKTSLSLPAVKSTSVLINNYLEKRSTPTAGQTWVDELADIIIVTLGIDTPEEVEEVANNRAAIINTLYKKIMTEPETTGMTPEEEDKV